MSQQSRALRHDIVLIEFKSKEFIEEFIEFILFRRILSNLSNYRIYGRIYRIYKRRQFEITILNSITKQNLYWDRTQLRMLLT